jgi:hypothetical protein
MVGAFILISAVDNLFDAKRKITSSTVNEFSLIILRRSNLGVCNSSIFLGRVSSMSLGLMHALKKACCYVVLDVRSIGLYSRTALYNRASTRAGEPVAPPSLSGLIIRVNVVLLLLLLLLLVTLFRLQRFSTTSILHESNILWAMNLLSAPPSMLGQSIATAFTLFLARYLAACSDRPGFSDM